MQIGELFILRINIHLQGSVLDAPELMWAEPQLDPIYQAVRSYLEMDQRVGLLTERLDVIADLLAVLKDQLTHTHGESLEWIGMSCGFVSFFWYSSMLNCGSHHSYRHGDLGRRSEHCGRCLGRRRLRTAINVLCGCIWYRN